jgi:hypothetical protein
MRFLLLPLFAICLINAELCAQDADVFGLAGMKPISQQEASEVRGAGAVSARTTGSAGITATILDPNTGSIWNFNVTQFNQVKDAKEPGWAPSGSSTFSELAIGLGDISASINEFHFGISGAGARAIGRTTAGAISPYFRRL